MTLLLPALITLWLVLLTFHLLTGTPPLFVACLPVLVPIFAILIVILYTALKQ